MIKKEMKRSLREFYRNIERLLVCGRCERKRIVASIESSVTCYLCEHPNADIEDIYANFGSAEEVADEYINNEYMDEIRSKIKRSKTIVFSIVIALIIAILIYIAAVVTALAAEIKATEGYATTLVETVSQSDN